MFFLFALLLVASSQAVQADTTCSFCEFVVQTVEGYVQNNATETQIINWLNNACGLLPSPYNALCSQEVNQYGPQLIERIVNKASPEVVCQKLHLCSASIKVPVPRVESQGTSCSVCQMIVTVVERYISNNATIGEIEAALDEICALLPGGAQTQCNAVVAKYTPQIVQWVITNQIDNICAKLGLCTAKLSKVHHARKVQSGSSCSVCELVVSFAEHYLASNGTLTKLEGAIEKLCAVLPSNLSPDCNAFVEQQVPALINWLIAKEDPQTFCTQVGLCTATKVHHKAHHKVHHPKKVTQSPCSLCEMIVSFVESYLASNATLSEIEAALGTSCSLLPSPYNSQCQQFVNTYLPELVQWIENNENPEQFCTQVHFCTAEVKKVEVTGSTTCSVCQLIVSYVENYIANNNSIAKIEDELNHVCSILPSPYNAACTVFVDQYTPQLVQWILNKENPQQFCTHVGLCTQTAEIKEIKKVQSGTGCSVCTLVVSFAENYLANNGTVTEIEGALEKLCSALPSPYNAACTLFVEQYTPQLVQWILANEDPQTFCTQVGLCSATKLHKIQRISGDKVCGLCELVVTFASNYISSNGTVTKIESALQQVCGVLPTSFQTQCKNLVASYTPQVIQWILAKENPEVFCTQVGLCARRAALLRKN